MPSTSTSWYSPKPRLISILVSFLALTSYCVYITALNTHAIQSSPLNQQLYSFLKRGWRLTRIRLPHSPFTLSRGVYQDQDDPAIPLRIIARSPPVFNPQVLTRIIPQRRSLLLQSREEGSGSGASLPRLHLDTIDIVIFSLVTFLALFTSVMTYIGRRHSRARGCGRFLCLLRPGRGSCSSLVVTQDKERALPVNAPEMDGVAGAAAVASPPHVKPQFRQDGTHDQPLEAPRLPAPVPMFFSNSERSLVARVYT